MADRLGISEDAAQKRVRRAVEHVRAFFGKRGVALGASALARLLNANAISNRQTMLRMNRNLMAPVPR